MKIEMQKRYVRLDAWGRGYYEFDNSIFSSAYLWGDEFGNETIKNRIEEIKTKLRGCKIPYSVVKTRTSNVCSVGVDILVPMELRKKALGVV